MDVIHKLIEEWEVKKAMNVIKRQERIRADWLRLWQVIVNAIDRTREEHKEHNTDEHIMKVALTSLFYMEDREFLKLIFWNDET